LRIKYSLILILLVFLSSCRGGGSGTSTPATAEVPVVNLFAPVLANITAQSTNEDTAKSVGLSGTDADGNPLTYTATSSNANVTTSITSSTLTATPALNWNGTATITAKAYDGTFYSPAKTFVLTVNAVDDAPIVASISNHTTPINTPKTVTISASDPEGSSLTYSLSSVPASKVSGSVSGTTLTLTPVTGYAGTAALTLTVSDGTLTTTKTFNLIVGADDPLYQYQWHLNNTGQTNFSSNPGTSSQDINVDTTIASGNRGAGIIVAIVDSGLEIAHEDLAANVVSGGSWDFVGGDTDPTPSSSSGDHGTSVAGLTAAVGWNSKGGRGVAPSASLKGFNFLQSTGTTNNVNSMGGASYSSDVDIFNKSYGISWPADFTVNTTVEAQLLSGVTSLRSGKGAIYVKSSGNGYNSIRTGSPGNYVYYVCSTIYGSNKDLSCQNSNQEPYSTLPYNIIVGALGAGGVKSSYSSAGSSVWVSAPGGEYGSQHPAMMTTDLSGCSKGYVQSSTSSGNDFNNSSGGSPHAENTGCKYTATFNGTSSAAPVLSGAIALILKANAALTWRDVKHILATTSDQVDASKGPNNLTVNGNPYEARQAWTTNGAGHKFHNWYGFGRVNVGAAVSAAGSYTAGSLGTFNTSAWQSSGALSASIPDHNPSGTSNQISVSGANSIEAVQIKVNVSHNATGDLAIELTSPAGTKSILMNAFSSYGTFNSNLTNMVLLSNAFYGESKAGNWTIKVIDAHTNGTGSLTNWSIRFFGH
jgi:subtilisin-like proprotein convertase family protein